MDFQRKQSYLEIPIQVGVRLRPVLDTDDPPSDERVELLPSGQVTVEGHLFNPTFCMTADVTQAELYRAAVEPQVDMLLQGYNVAVVAFGQSGSGKTYTLVGPEATFAMSEAEFGVLPRAVRHMFTALKASGESGEHGFTLRTSYLEVGQQQLRDLLNYESVTYHLDVQFDQQGSPVIPGLTVLECASVSEVLHCLESGASMRRAACSAAGEQQAHTVFTVHLQQQWADGVLLHETSSSFQFVECCGSELQPAPDDPDDFTIDAELLALQQVLQALLQRRPSVPYTAARLPAVLKDVVGGNCRTLLLCCLSPADTDESLAALQYVRPFSALHNLVACGASQRPRPLPEPAAASAVPRQVHPVHPLQHPDSPRPPEPPKPPQQQQQQWCGYGPTMAGYRDSAGWPPQLQEGAAYPPAYGGFSRREAPLQHQQLSPMLAAMEAQRLSGNPLQMAGQSQQVLSPSQPLLSPAQRHLNRANPTVNQALRGGYPLSQQMQNLSINGNPDMTAQNQVLSNHEHAVTNQNQSLMDSNQRTNLQHCANRNIQVAHSFLDQGQLRMSQDPSGMNMNHGYPNQSEPGMNPPSNRRLSLHTLYQNSINRIQQPQMTSTPYQAHPNTGLNQSLPFGHRDQHLALHQPQPSVSPPSGNPLSQCLPPFGPHHNLVVGPMRPAAGGQGLGNQSAVVHPFHHQPTPARLAELGYTASPPLTNLTELSCHRAALLHENALVDLYQRLHVLELHQLAAAQQVALTAQQPPPSASEPPKEDDQIFQLEFAAEQYRGLVAAAERLLQELAVDGEQRGRVQEWMCRKQETDECLRSGEAAVDSDDDELRRLEETAAGSGPGSEAGAEQGAEAASRRGVAWRVAATAADLPERGRTPEAHLPVAGDPGPPTGEETRETAAGGIAQVPVDIKKLDVESFGITSESHQIPPSRKQTGVDGPPAETSTPKDGCSGDRQVAADKLQAQLQQLNATLEAKEAQLRALTEPAAEGGESEPPPQGGEPEPPTEPAQGGDMPRARTKAAARRRGSPVVETLQQSPSGGPVSRRRRPACTEDDLRVLRRSGEVPGLPERLSADGSDGVLSPERRLKARQRLPSPTPPEPAAAAAAAADDRQSAEVCETGDLDPGPPDPEDPAALRREIQNLRDCRESLHSQRKRINSKLFQGGGLDGCDARRLLELDEAMHAVDEVLEQKAARLAGAAPAGDGGRLLLHQRQLMPRLLALSGAELRLLYCRTFQRLVDQRLDGREKDLAVADLDAQTDEQRRTLKRLQRMVHDLMKERSHYRRQRDELRRRLQPPRGSSGPTVAPLPPAALAAPLPPEPAAPAAVAAAAPHPGSRAPSDASSAPEPVLAPASAPLRLRQMLLSGLSRPAAASPGARVTRQRNRVIIQSAAQAPERRARR